jgi:hypothetical protein
MRIGDNIDAFGDLKAVYRYPWGGPADVFGLGAEAKAAGKKAKKRHPHYRGMFGLGQVTVNTGYLRFRVIGPDGKVISPTLDPIGQPVVQYYYYEIGLTPNDGPGDSNFRSGTVEVGPNGSFVLAYAPTPEAIARLGRDIPPYPLYLSLAPIFPTGESSTPPFGKGEIDFDAGFKKRMFTFPPGPAENASELRIALMAPNAGLPAIQPPPPPAAPAPAQPAPAAPAPTRLRPLPEQLRPVSKTPDASPNKTKDYMPLILVGGVALLIGFVIFPKIIGGRE